MQLPLATRSNEKTTAEEQRQNEQGPQQMANGGNEEEEEEEEMTILFDSTTTGSIGGHQREEERERERADSLEQFLLAVEQQQNEQRDTQQQQRENGLAAAISTTKTMLGTMAGWSCGMNMRANDERTNAASAANPALVPLANELAPLKSAPSDQQLDVLLAKLSQCRVVDGMDWGQPEANRREKEVKRRALVEIGEFMATRRGKELMAQEQIVAEQLVEMVRANLFRVFAPRVWAHHQQADQEDDFFGGILCGAQQMEPAWEHLQLVYRLLQQTVECVGQPEYGISLAARHFDAAFVGQLLELFHSVDGRERRQLKALLYSLYSRLVPLRADIRKRMGWLLLAHAFEQMPFNGVAELLEILGDVVNGFNVPLKSEHCDFFVRVLLPLHKSPNFGTYFAQLAYCVALFLEKQSSLGVPAVRALLKHWPIGCSTKEVQFISELEEMIVRITPDEFRQLSSPLMQRLAKCATSQHFKVVERVLSLWNNENMLKLIAGSNDQTSFSVIFTALHRVSQFHWNQTAIVALVYKTLKNLMSINGTLFDQMVFKSEYQQRQQMRTNSPQKGRQQNNEPRDELWQRLIEVILEERRRKDPNDEDKVERRRPMDSNLLSAGNSGNGNVPSAELHQQQNVRQMAVM